MLKRMFCLAVLAATFAAAGCADLMIGHPINKSKVQEIIPGRTTRDEIQSKEWFGTPLRIVKGADGDILVYRYSEGNGRCDELIISLNGDVVTCYSQQ